MIMVFLFILGSVLGSFLIASVWRLRSQEKKVNKLKSLRSTNWKTDYSRCLDCGYRLKWYDLIPIISWLWLRGKCRGCHKSIGYLEITAEIMMGVVLALSYYFWPANVSIISFGVWIVILSLGLILFVYDLKWQSLPSSILYVLIIAASIFSLINLNYHDWLTSVWNLGWSVLSVGGIYLALYLISKGKWVGDGDWYLGVAIGLVLNNWLLGLMTIFGANLLGTLWLISWWLVKRQLPKKIAFGPLLLAAGYLTFIFSPYILAFSIFAI